MADMSHPEEGLSQATAASSEAQVKNTTPVYEVGFHLVPALDEAGVLAAVAAIHKMLGDAEIISETAPQRMALAYVIERATQGKRDKYSEAYFGFIKFATPRENIPGIEEALRANREVLRYLLVATVREDMTQAPRRAVYSSDRLEGKTLERAPREAEKTGAVDEGELDKSIEALVKE
jgi:ribosomal protein S6